MAPSATAAVIAAIAAAMSAASAIGGEMHGPRATWRDDTLEAQSHRRRVTVEGECHGLPGQRLDFAVEQRLGDTRRLVPATRWLAGGVTRLALHKVALRGSLHLNLQVGFQA